MVYSGVFQFLWLSRENGNTGQEWVGEWTKKMQTTITRPFYSISKVIISKRIITTRYKGSGLSSGLSFVFDSSRLKEIKELNCARNCDVKILSYIIFYISKTKPPLVNDGTHCNYSSTGHVIKSIMCSFPEKLNFQNIGCKRNTLLQRCYWGASTSKFE